MFIQMKDAKNKNIYPRHLGNSSSVPQICNCNMILISEQANNTAES